MESNLDSSDFASCSAESHNLPDSVNMRDFCENRMEEILMLTEALKESPFRGQAFQRLPKHMRRRQMSHCIKRLPRILQTSNFLSLKKDASSVPKRPSRKYRRRSKNLLLEYNRRQRKNIWLETHIWHSKRFQMISKWGYRLAEKPSNKCFRACYRAIAEHCFLHDMSYYNTIELRGVENELLQGLQQCVSPSCGLTFAAKMYKSGLREGSVMLYHPNTFPYNAIGQIFFLWKPINEEENIRTLWIFSHPVFYDEIVSMFKTLFSLQEIKSSEIIIKEEEDLTMKTECKVENENLKKCNVKKKKLKKFKISENAKLEAKNLPFVKTPKYKNSNGSICVTLLKDTINRFRLIGPLSLAVIVEAFDLSFQQSVISEKTEVSVTGNTAATDTEINCLRSFLKRKHSSEFEYIENAKKIKRQDCSDALEHEVIKEEQKNEIIWWSNYYKNAIHKKCLEKQIGFFEKLKSMKIASELPPKMVISLVVTDPRLVIPPKRIKSKLNASEETHFISSADLDSELCKSPLWEPEVRDEVSKLKMATSEINKIRSKFIVPGSDIKSLFREEGTKVPIILIQREGTSGTDMPGERNGFGSGFDIISPAGWAMPIWTSLIFRGARSGGLRESNSLLLESNNLRHYFQPDSCAGETESLELFNKLKVAYFKRPPSKRPNYSKAGVLCPFYIPWKVLVRDWKNHVGNGTTNAESDNKEITYYVLREREKLMELSELIRSAGKILKLNKPCKLGNSFSENEMDCLVEVSVECSKKGVPNRFAMICLPTAEDVKNFKKNNPGPVENSHPDKNEKARKLLRTEHAKLLKSLKRKRKKLKMKELSEMREMTAEDEAWKEESSNRSKERRIPSTEDVVHEFNSKMNGLWLEEPDSIDSVINSCSRKIIGFIVIGGYSYSRARGLGLGYVSLRGLLYMLERCYKTRMHPLVLFRNTNNVQYNFGKITVCTN